MFLLLEFFVMRGQIKKPKVLTLDSDVKIVRDHLFGSDMTAIILNGNFVPFFKTEQKPFFCSQYRAILRQASFASQKLRFISFFFFFFLFLFFFFLFFCLVFSSFYAFTIVCLAAQMFLLYLGEKYLLGTEISNVVGCESFNLYSTARRLGVETFTADDSLLDYIIEVGLVNRGS